VPGIERSGEARELGAGVTGYQAWLHVV